MNILKRVDRQRNSLLIFIFIIVALSGQICAGAESKNIRAPAVTGAFYPDEAEELKKTVGAHLSDASPPEVKGKILGIMVPHAGYVFSGLTAAHGFKAVKARKVDTVILFGDAHRAHFKGASVYLGEGYRTPLGVVTIDRELAEEIAEMDKHISFIPGAHTAEHSIEVELPFLQTIYDDIKIVPVLFGYDSMNTQASIIQKLPESLKGRDVLLVASSDLSHYPPEKQAKRTDKKTLEAVCSLDDSHLAKTLNESMKAGVPNLQTPMCGNTAVMTVMRLSKALGADKGILLHYSNSADSPYGDSKQVVGYGAAAFYQASEEQEIQRDSDAEKASAGEELNSGGKLNQRQKSVLIKLARRTLNSYVTERKKSDFESTESLFEEKRGAFVTLKKNGRLRGCIGYIQPVKPLWRTIIDNAVNAAVNDHRFPPVQPGELKDIEIEISVLTPLKPVESKDDIVIGKHGIQIFKNGRSAVFLPQVAPEQGWEIEETLRQLSRKAGLPADAWKSDMNFFVFEAQVFEEIDFHCDN